jgi:hypothetical protein
MKTTHSDNTIHKALLAGLLAGLSLLNGYGQFSSGSTGTNGALNITTNTTLQLWPHGQFHYTAVTIASNATLTFTPNSLNTPVYLLAQGDVVINGTIDVSGKAPTGAWGGAGGPGGFPGGNAGNDGYGPGAGRYRSGCASYGSGPAGERYPANSGTTYGSPLLVPLVGGSGGSGFEFGSYASYGGSGGGGAILVASSTTVTVSATGGITAKGGDAWGDEGGLGSGGGIRVVAPVIAGLGYLDAKGGRNAACYGGNGRTRIDCLDRRSMALSCDPTASIGAYMVVFPTNAPRLDITQVAGNDIPVGTNSSVFFLLPENAPTNQPVTVQARNFGAQVPIRVVLTPETGSRTFYDTNIDNSTINPASLTITLVVPVNLRVRVDAWSR